MEFTPSDLAVAGLAADIVGGYLLARGLLLSNQGIAALNTWGGIPDGAMIERCKNRVDAQQGLVLLLIGFGLQALSYFVQIGGAAEHTGASSLAGALIIIAVVVAASGVATTLLRPPMLARTIRSVVAVDGEDVWSDDDVKRFVQLGELGGLDAREEETSRDHVRRVFGVVAGEPKAY